MRGITLASVAIAAWALAACAEPLYGPGRDFLTPELRAPVEALKAEVAQGAPTTMNNLDARLGVLWPWANALAAQGANLPVELPRVVSQGRQIGLRRQYAMVVLPSINGFVRELQIKEEEPGAIGAVTASASGPWPVRSLVSFEQTYTLGDLPMQPGGGVMVASEIVARMDPFQREDAKAKNFISIRCSNPAAQWEPSTEQILGMHGSIFGARGVPSYQLKGATLKKGDTITIVYGDKSGGGPGLELQTTQVHGAMFPLYVDLEGKGNFLSPRWPKFNIIGGPAARVTAFAPSVLAPGERFDLKVRTEDFNFNRASAAVPAFDITLNGEKVSTLAPGKDGIGVLQGLTLATPGVYRYEVASPDGKISALSNPIWVAENPPYRVFWGDTHAHTNMAEGQGDVEGFYTYARDDARLDFVCLSEHDIWMDDGEWAAMGEAVRNHNDEGNFVTFLAYEWSAIVEAGGHHNVYFRTPEERRRVPIQDTPGLWDLFKGLDRLYPAGDVMIIPHAHIPGDWRLAHPRIEPLVEMVSMHGTFEWFADYYLRNGHMIGFVGATDDHSGRPGYSGGFIAGPLQHFGGLSAVLAPEKRSTVIFDAMKDRLAYATSGQRTLLDVRLNGKPMGQRLEYSPQRRIEGRVMGTAPIDTVDVVKNGRVLTTTHYLGRTRAPEGWLQVALYSQSEDLIRDAPRGDRIWLGTIDIEGAELVSAETIGLGNYEGEWVKRDETNPRRIQFRMSSRGAEERILLHLTGVSDATHLRMHTEPTDEEGVTFPRTYVPAKKIPTVDFDFDFKGFNGGDLTRSIPAGRYTDAVALRWVDPKGALDQPISYTDNEPPADGDYYYLRVTQLDGRMAWSSPWWVGGVPVR
jgi:hypothetical protein